jgi:hypothetical protein
MDYWRKKLAEAEAELEAARKRSDVNAAAAKLQRAKAELKALEKAPKDQRPSPRRGRSIARLTESRRRGGSGSPLFALAL